MKPASLTITYTVYSPNYRPGDPYVSDVETLAKAYRQSRKYGVGAEIVRNFRTRHHDGSGAWFSDPRIWTYVGKAKRRQRRKVL